MSLLELALAALGLVALVYAVALVELLLECWAAWRAR